MTLQNIINEGSDYENIEKISQELNKDIVEFYKSKGLRQSLDYTSIFKKNSGMNVNKKIRENKLKVIVKLEKGENVKKFASTSKENPRYFYITIISKEPIRIDSLAHEITHVFDYIKSWPKALGKDSFHKEHYSKKNQNKLNKAYIEYGKSFDLKKAENIQNMYLPYFKNYAEFNARLTNLLRNINKKPNIIDSYKNILIALEIPITDKYLFDKDLKKMILARLYREGIIPNFIKDGKL
jgi:hypothetical protein